MGTSAGPQKANTKDEDPTGLLNEGFRYRDLESGVFITRDPAGFVDGPNVYTYVTQNPWTYYDPLGLDLAGWMHETFGPAPQAVRDLAEFDQAHNLLERTNGGIKVVGGALEVGVAVAAAPFTAGGSLVGAAHGMDMMMSGSSDIITGEASRTVTHQVIGGYAMMAGASFETADTIGGFGDAAVGIGSSSLNAGSIIANETRLISSAQSNLQATTAEVSVASPKGPLITRVGEVHEALDPVAARMRTTAGLDTGEGTRVFGGGARDLTPAQRALLGEGEAAAKMPGAHAEATVLQHATDNGLTPRVLETSRDFCSGCQKLIEEAGGTIVDPRKATW